MAFFSDYDYVLDLEDALEHRLHPCPSYVGQLEMLAREYENQLWDQRLAEDTPPEEPEIEISYNNEDCRFCINLHHYTSQKGGKHVMNCPVSLMSEETADNTNCVMCGKPTQPEGGVRFYSIGEYGSTVLDSNHDRGYLVMFVCDECLCRKQRKILEWRRGQKGYRSFNPDCDVSPRAPSITITHEHGRFHVSQKLGFFSKKGKAEEAKKLKAAFAEADKAIDEAIQRAEETPEEMEARHEAMSARMSAHTKEILERVGPALEHDNIRSFGLDEVPRLEQRSVEILSAEMAAEAEKDSQ